jgi:hypothetical protein
LLIHHRNPQVYKLQGICLEAAYELAYLYIFIEHQ